MMWDVEEEEATVMMMRWIERGREMRGDLCWCQYW